MHTGIKNNNQTNRLILLLIIAGDFAVLFVTLYFATDLMPRSENWDGVKERVFWMMCTLALVVAEYFFSVLVGEYCAVKLLFKVYRRKLQVVVWFFVRFTFWNAVRPPSSSNGG